MYTISYSGCTFDKFDGIIRTDCVTTILIASHADMLSTNISI